MCLRTVFNLALFLVCTTGLGQSKVQPYAGLYFSGDAAMDYIGPSYQLGVDVPLKAKWLINGYGHYFSASAVFGQYEVFTIGVMAQYSLGKNNRWYIAVGIAYQNAKEEAYYDAIDRSIFLPSYRLGYKFLFKTYVFYSEIFTTGPYSSSGSHVYNGQTYYGGSTDIFTLPSVGIRVKRKPIVRVAR